MADFGALFSWLSLPLLSVFFITLVMVYMMTGSKKNLPPGPTPLPIIGNLLLFLRKTFLELVDELRPKYGDVICLKNGSQTIVVISGYECIQEAFVKHGDDFSDRPMNIVPAQIRQGHGIIFSSGKLWKDTRTFTLKSLREFGFGKRSLESTIIEEVEYFIQAIELKGGKEFCMDRLAQISICNIICSIINGQRYEHDDPDLNKLLKLIEENFTTSTVVARAFAALLRFLPFDPFKVRRQEHNILRVMNFHNEIIEEHKRHFIENEEAKDLIESFLIERKHNESSAVSDKSLIGVILDLYLAGTETTATTIKWAIAIILHHPEIQEKLHNEIIHVIGNSRKPSLNDKTNMPYFQAFMLEVLRFSELVPLAVPHYASHDIKFRGSTIPEKSTILLNIHSVLYDQAQFLNPKKFDPSRFIDENGVFINHPYVIPFGAGRRICLGESLARAELFLFLATMFQHFEFVPGGELPDLKGIYGFTHFPRQFNCMAKPRAFK